MWVTTETINSNLLKSDGRIIEVLAGTRNETVLLTEDSIVKTSESNSKLHEQSHGPSEAFGEEPNLEELL